MPAEKAGESVPLLSVSALRLASVLSVVKVRSAPCELPALLLALTR